MSGQADPPKTHGLRRCNFYELQEQKGGEAQVEQFFEHLSTVIDLTAMTIAANVLQRACTALWRWLRNLAKAFARWLRIAAFLWEHRERPADNSLTAGSISGDAEHSTTGAEDSEAAKTGCPKKTDVAEQRPDKAKAAHPEDPDKRL